MIRKSEKYFQKYGGTEWKNVRFFLLSVFYFDIVFAQYDVRQVWWDLVKTWTLFYMVSLGDDCRFLKFSGCFAMYGFDSGDFGKIECMFALKHVGEKGHFGRHLTRNLVEYRLLWIALQTVNEVNIRKRNLRAKVKAASQEEKLQNWKEHF